jgi:hypothetical protein
LGLKTLRVSSQPSSLPAIHLVWNWRRQKEIEVPEIPVPVRLVNKLKGVCESSQIRVVNANIGPGTVLASPGHAYPEVGHDSLIEFSVGSQ